MLSKLWEEKKSHVTKSKQGWTPLYAMASLVLLSRPGSPTEPEAISTLQSMDEKESLPCNVQMKDLWALIAPEWKLLSIGVGGMFISSATNLMVPKILGYSIEIASGKKAPFHLSKMSYLSSVLAIFLSGAIASCTRVYCLGLVSERTAARIRRKLYAKLLRKKLTFFQENQVGELLHKLGNDAQVVADSVVDLFANSFRCCNSTIGGCAMLLSISPSLTLTSVSVLPLVGTTVMLCSEFSSQLVQRHAEATGRLMGLAEERLHNIRTVKLFVQEDREERLFDEQLVNMYAWARKAKAARGLFMGTTSMSINLSLLAILYFGGSLVGKGSLTVGSLTSFAFYSAGLGMGFSGLSSVYGETKKVKESFASLRRLVLDEEHLEESPVDDGVEDTKLSKLATQSSESLANRLLGKITFKNVHFQYPHRPDISVLNGFNMEILPGQVVALVGRSGAGKSTILSLLLKLYEPMEGDIFLDDVSLIKNPRVKAKWVRQHIGVVEQEPSLLSGTIASNICYGCTSEASDFSRDDMIQAAIAAHAHEFIMSLPDQYETIVHANGANLSGGQKQRLAIARAIFKNPSILVLDEATASLDALSEEAVKIGIENAMKNRTVLIIAHGEGWLNKADRIIELENGKAKESMVRMDETKKYMPEKQGKGKDEGEGKGAMVEDEEEPFMEPAVAFP